MKRSGKWGIVVGVVLAAAIIAGVVDAIDARERRTIITGPQVVEHWYSWGTAHDPNCQPLGRPKLPEDYTGYWEARYENGQLAIQRRYENGERHGLQRTWYQDGRLRTRVRYVHGNPEGLSTGWDVRGRKEWELPFRDGTREGKSIRWESDGTKVEEVEYVNGRRRKCTAGAGAQLSCQIRD